jgi:hypothetical protein
LSCRFLLFFLFHSLSARSDHNLYNLSHLHRKMSLFVLILHMKRIYSNYLQFSKFVWCWHKDCKMSWRFVSCFESSLSWHSCLSFLSRELITTEWDLQMMIVSFSYLESIHINSSSKSLLDLVVSYHNVNDKSFHCWWNHLIVDEIISLLTKSSHCWRNHLNVDDKRRDENDKKWDEIKWLILLRNIIII